MQPYISSLTVYTESRVCVCSTCVAVFARCVELSRGCGMIRAKSSTTQVCFICGVAGCEIRGWRSRSIFNRLPRAATLRWLTMICRLSDQTLSKIRGQSSALIPILVLRNYAKPDVLREANYLYYVRLYYSGV